jgi:predicted enzyme related to lactoylglutathione lyase
MAAATPGRFIWHELLTTDTDGAIPFYEHVMGWSTISWDQDPSYRIFAWEGIPMAGLMTLPEQARSMGAPPHWLSYVSVRDLDATLADAARLGAMTYVDAMVIQSVGRIAVLGDPQRAVFGIYEPSASAGHGSDEPGLGDFSWHELATDDWKAAWEFYQALFGWEYDSQFDMGPMGTYWMFRRAGGARTLGGMFTRPPEIPASHWLPYARVPSAQRAADLVGQNGGTVLNGPMEVPGGDLIVQIMDPQGAAFAMHSVAAKTEAATAPAEATPTPEPSVKAESQRPAPPKKAGAGKPASKPTARKPVKKAPPKPKGRPVKKKPVKKR